MPSGPAEPRNAPPPAGGPDAGHSYTVFRVRMNGLKPEKTYHYTVDSMEAKGHDDGVKSSVRYFTTP
jgi:hypothetical protein